jgi:hypothetical protein
MTPQTPSKPDWADEQCRKIIMDRVQHKGIAKHQLTGLCDAFAALLRKVRADTIELAIEKFLELDYERAVAELARIGQSTI